MIAYTQSGAARTLREPPLSAGGEGAVYEIQGNSGFVAKIYHDPADAKAREQKILTMAQIARTPLFNKEKLGHDIAWPLAPLYDAAHAFCGFEMMRIDGNRELEDLYVYPSPPGSAVTMQDRVTALLSLCSAIERLHRVWQIFGDFNPNNIKIMPDYSVRLVDADSYHVRLGDKVFRCVVCAPGYVAPEVIRACAGTTYADCPGTTFTPESDNFALAIHCFRMLMNGCHPFSSRPVPPAVGSAPAPLSLDKRVERGETPFFSRVPNAAPPVFAPDVDSLPPYLRALFRRAFVTGHANPAARPTAGEWRTALERLRRELVPCTHNPLHAYWNGAPACPYCEADARRLQITGPRRAASAPAGPSAGFALPTHAAPAASAAPAVPVATVVTYAPPVPPAPPAKKRGDAFNGVTMGLQALVQILISPAMRQWGDKLFGDGGGEVQLLCFGLGLAGTAIYNMFCIRPSGRMPLRKYALSLLAGIGGSVGWLAAIVVLAFLMESVARMVA
ncbi:MAG: hypothetical protein ACOX83_06155 [Candidatus Spyradocola sp.]|jgi:DNA-binding helix-hairpin-helix protein with protein kinase domain